MTYEDLNDSQKTMKARGGARQELRKVIKKQKN